MQIVELKNARTETAHLQNDIDSRVEMTGNRICKTEKNSTTYPA